jgi:hypothetical protein
MAGFAPSTIDESGTIADLRELNGTDTGSITNAVRPSFSTIGVSLNRNGSSSLSVRICDLG